ncbi:putative DNA-directed RNA polymerase [Helianthus debilis subsp. tardiflorus]
MKQKFSSMIDRYTHQQLRIGLVSPQQISTWSKKISPNGEIVGEVTDKCLRIILHYLVFWQILVQIERKRII